MVDFANVLRCHRSAVFHCNEHINRCLLHSLVGEVINAALFGRVKFVDEVLVLRRSDLLIVKFLQVLLHARIFESTVWKLPQKLHSPLVELPFGGLKIIHVKDVAELVLVKIEIWLVELFNQSMSVMSISHQAEDFVALKQTAIVDALGCWLWPLCAFSLKVQVLRDELC